MTTKRLIIAAILFFIGMLWIPAQQTATLSTLEVSETASVSAPANLVRISFAVESDAGDAGESVRQNAQQTDALLKALRKMGAEGDRLETSGYRLNPMYARGSSQAPTTYRVRNMVVLTSKNIKNAGAYIDAATAAGATNVDSLSFSHDQGELLRDKASVKALQKAVKTAERLAQAAGLTVKRIVKINYSSPGPVVRYARTALAEAGGAPTPIEAGDLSVSATIFVVFEIG
jgi:uncharacterized protein YggE